MPISNKSLFIKKSNLSGAGLGLFAKIIFRKGDRIVEYKGRRQPWKEVKAEDGHNGYLLRLSRNLAINALPYKKAFGRFANDASGLGKTVGLRNNAEYLIYGDRCFIEATRTINKGDEILVSYGKEFWMLQKTLKEILPSGKNLPSGPNSR